MVFHRYASFPIIDSDTMRLSKDLFKSYLTEYPFSTANSSGRAVCRPLIRGIADSSPAEGRDIRLIGLVCCVGSALCDGLITRLENSHRVFVLSNCVRSRNLSNEVT
jgi:hypothetical protein